MNRRDFLASSALASCSLLVPKFLKATDDSGFKGKRLVVIQFSGGNDGLNTIVPYADDVYYSSRSGIAIPKQEVLKIDDYQGFNPVLKPLQSFLDAGHLSIYNAVGYPNPNRSHFRSMDIWHSASNADQYLETGWLGRYLDNCCDGKPLPRKLLELDDSLSLALKGEKSKGMAASHPERFKQLTSENFLKQLAYEDPHGHAEADYLYKTLAETVESAGYLYQKSKQKSSKAVYPTNEFGKKLKQVSELIQSGCDTTVYYLSVSGFDTHVNQKPTQDRLLSQWAESLDVFRKEMMETGFWKDTMVLTFSEFGRRVGQNASRGTDHGTANNLFLMGGTLSKPGIQNAAPSLTDLDEGDLKFKLDFRTIYSDVLNNWLGVDSKKVLNGIF